MRKCFSWSGKKKKSDFFPQFWQLYAIIVSCYDQTTIQRDITLNKISKLQASGLKKQAQAHTDLSVYYCNSL